MRGITTELKVGLFALIVLAILTFMTFKVGGIDFLRRDGYVVYIYFKNIAGLDEKTKVKIAGVNAGMIERIELHDGRAKLTVRMNKEVALYSDARASIKAAGLLGDKYLEIKTGSEQPVLTNGDTLTTVVEIVDLDDLTRNLTAVSENFNILAKTLNETLGTEESRDALKKSILNLRDITSSVKETIALNDQRLRTTLDNINELVASMSELVQDNRENVSSAMRNMKDFSKMLKEDGPEIVVNLNEAAKELKTLIEETRPSIQRTTETVDQIAQKIDKGEGTLGKLVQDDELYDSVNNAAKSIEKTVSAVERFRTFLTFQGEYLTEPSDGKGYFYLTLQPRPERYYILGVVSDPLGRVKTKKTVKKTDSGTTKIKREEIKEDEIEFTAQYAMRYHDAALRLGVTESTFGAGMDYFFFDDKLRFSADIWDFDSDEEGSNDPHLKFGFDYFVFKNLFVSVGADNILNERWRGGYAGLGLRIEDEDFKYLLGTLPSINP